MFKRWEKVPASLHFTISDMKLDKQLNGYFQIHWTRGEHSGRSNRVLVEADGRVAFNCSFDCPCTMYIAKSNKSIRQKNLRMTVYRIVGDTQKVFGKIVLDVSPYFMASSPVNQMLRMESGRKSAPFINSIFAMKKTGDVEDDNVDENDKSFIGECNETYKTKLEDWDVTEIAENQIRRDAKEVSPSLVSLKRNDNSSSENLKRHFNPGMLVKKSHSKEEEMGVLAVIEEKEREEEDLREDTKTVYNDIVTERNEMETRNQMNRERLIGVEKEENSNMEEKTAKGSTHKDKNKKHRRRNNDRQLHEMGGEQTEGMLIKEPLIQNMETNVKQDTLKEDNESEHRRREENVREETIKEYNVKDKREGERVSDQERSVTNKEEVRDGIYKADVSKIEKTTVVNKPSHLQIATTQSTSSDKQLSLSDEQPIQSMGALNENMISSRSNDENSDMKSSLGQHGLDHSENQKETDLNEVKEDCEGQSTFPLPEFDENVTNNDFEIPFGIETTLFQPCTPSPSTRKYNETVLKNIIPVRSSTNTIDITHSQSKENAVTRHNLFEQAIPTSSVSQEDFVCSSSVNDTHHKDSEASLNTHDKQKHVTTETLTKRNNQETIDITQTEVTKTVEASTRRQEEGELQSKMNNVESSVMITHEDQQESKRIRSSDSIDAIHSDILKESHARMTESELSSVLSDVMKFPWRFHLKTQFSDCANSYRIPDLLFPLVVLAKECDWNIPDTFIDHISSLNYSESIPLLLFIQQMCPSTSIVFDLCHENAIQSFLKSHQTSFDIIANRICSPNFSSSSVIEDIQGLDNTIHTNMELPAKCKSYLSRILLFSLDKKIVNTLLSIPERFNFTYSVMLNSFITQLDQSRMQFSLLRQVTVALMMAYNLSLDPTLKDDICPDISSDIVAFILLNAKPDDLMPKKIDSRKFMAARQVKQVSDHIYEEYTASPPAINFDKSRWNKVELSEEALKRFAFLEKHINTASIES